jgi:hypothetical protein
MSSSAPVEAPLHMFRHAESHNAEESICQNDADELVAGVGNKREKFHFGVYFFGRKARPYSKARSHEELKLQNQLGPQITIEAIAPDHIKNKQSQNIITKMLSASLPPSWTGAGVSQQSAKLDLPAVIAISPSHSSTETPTPSRRTSMRSERIAKVVAFYEGLDDSNSSLLQVE